MKVINNRFLQQTFPLENNKFKNPYEEDLVLSVDDVKKFHQENFLKNKQHYPATSKLFKAKLATFFQYYGAKVHFNYIPSVNEDTGVKNYIRYLIIEHSDLVRDLNYWETFSVSNLMHRPIEVVHNEEWFLRNDEIQHAFLQNRISACSLALLNAKYPAYPEKVLYSNILNLTKYRSKGLKLIDYEDTDLVVDKQFDEFTKIYRPILQNHEPFGNRVQMIENNFDPSQLIINTNNDKQSQIKYLMNVNDNVFKNIASISVRSYDAKMKFTKKQFSEQDKFEEAEEILNDYPTKKKLDTALSRSIDKIMIANRNTKLFFILMSGPFFAGMMLFKKGKGAAKNEEPAPVIAVV
ncbi:UNKNOWN [Stylonychia lemnae]|uniref:Phosphatidate cytidylyltransferase, mitochondrial n=1 Tax=Stylonychia lemnae TaxID=5949 RepID=A0A078A0R1_STYLE|nr:UNKNOWN [Stylonychia lemnae]|eukprot:CDW75442.1 UNKNOWN [Stylonychia lemnae]